MAEHGRTRRRDDAVLLILDQVRLMLAAFEAAGAHGPDRCTGECHALLEHEAITLLRMVQHEDLSAGVHRSQPPQPAAPSGGQIGGHLVTASAMTALPR